MEEYNPWWIGEIDPIYEEWLSSEVKWRPHVIEKFNFTPFSLHFFIGPRQVGKTTTIKILIHDLIRYRDPRSIFYYSCDEIADYRELGEVIDNYLSARREWGIRSSIIFLDEVTFVDEWYRAIKSRIDRGVLRNDVLVVTGSASLELVAGKEMFPGRRGHGRDIYMLPLSFSEYLLHFSGIKLIEAELTDIDYYMRKIEGNKLYAATISDMFMKYLETGGYPTPIKEYFTKGRVTYLSMRVLIDWLKTDWIKAGRSEGYMKEVISYILEAELTPVGWHTISKNTSISSPHTAREYVETLERLMVAKILYWISPSGKIDYRKAKKIIFTDPFIYKTLQAYTRTSVSISTIVEATVASHIARYKPTYYWRNKSEVDVVTLINGKPIGIEVKWTRKPKQRRRPFKTYTLDKNTIPLFLASLTG
ncbi:MAG: hypothetical protein DRJ32_03425 [Thermoprotei archaeon]|nr:MAG: hypothetical protein DRJ32_03425 [Thermoprotei archaeon]